MASAASVTEFGDLLRSFASESPFPYVYANLADLVDESGIYGVRGAYHFVLWVKYWMWHEEKHDQAMRKEEEPEKVGLLGQWYNACIVPDSKDEEPLLPYRPLHGDGPSCEAAAEKLKETFLPAISLEGKPWQDGVLDWWRANQTKLLPLCISLMHDDKEGAEKELREVPPSYEDRDAELDDILSEDEETFCEEWLLEKKPHRDGMAGCHQLYTVTKMIFEARRPGLWGAYHFVERLVSWMILHVDEVFETPGLDSCYFTTGPAPHAISSRSLASATDVKTTSPACTRASKKVKKSLKHVTENKHFPWQPEVGPWWEQHQPELVAQIATVHLVASDDFDDYMMWAAQTPDVPDTSKDASYFAALQIYQVVNDAQIYGHWGAYHLVSRVSKWMVVNPGPVKKWEKACHFQSNPLPPSTHAEDPIVGDHLNSVLLRRHDASY